MADDLPLVAVSLVRCGLNVQYLPLVTHTRRYIIRTPITRLT